MSVTAVGSIVAVCIMLGLGFYSWYLKKQLTRIESVPNTSEQNNKRIEAVEAQADAHIEKEASDVKAHAYDSNPTDLLTELHATVTGRPAT
jgi:hypothetical protein